MLNASRLFLAEGPPSLLWPIFHFLFYLNPQSPRFGRIWTQASYNLETQRYEVEFDENWWPGGWRIGTTDAFGERGPQQGLTRGQLLRVLGTASSISIVTSSGDSEGLRDMRLSGLAIQLALPTAPINDPFAPQAPVEVCDCPEPSKPDERALSLSCEVNDHLFRLVQLWFEQ